MRMKIEKWGNSAAIRLPKAVIEKTGFEIGTEVEISSEVGRLIIRRAGSKLSLDELLKDVTPEKMGGEMDCGPDVGREIIED